MPLRHRNIVNKSRTNKAPTFEEIEITNPALGRWQKDQPHYIPDIGKYYNLPMLFQ